MISYFPFILLDPKQIFRSIKRLFYLKKIMVVQFAAPSPKATITFLESNLS